MLCLIKTMGAWVNGLVFGAVSTYAAAATYVVYDRQKTVQLLRDTNKILFNVANLKNDLDKMKGSKEE